MVLEVKCIETVGCLRAGCGAAAAVWLLRGDVAMGAGGGRGQPLHRRCRRPPCSRNGDGNALNRLPPPQHYRFGQRAVRVASCFTGTADGRPVATQQRSSHNLACRQLHSQQRPVLG